MYIIRVEIENIRSIKHLVWEIDATKAPGWHVILGDNGSGKSSFVKSISIGIIGKDQATLLRQDWSRWITNNQKGARLHLSFMLDVIYDFRGFNFEAASQLIRSKSEEPNFPYWTSETLLWKEAMEAKGGRIIKLNGIASSTAREDNSYLLHLDTKFTGFACAFGPFRRFLGGDSEDQQLLDSINRVSRHLTVFSERIALPEGLEWLKQLKFQELEGDAGAKTLLENVIQFVSQDKFLQHDARLNEVRSSGVFFRDGNGRQILVEEMSDGYRSVLSLTFELLRQLSIAYGPDIFETHEDGKVTVKVPGVVQIDEVDAHLHPTWQKRIGFWFREHFPQMQFIVTTHSPLVCQAAERGSIFLLPRPGTDETGRMLEGAERDRLVYGDITDAYSTEAFSGGNTRSPAGQDMLERLGELNVKEMLHGLTKAEEQEQERLRLALPSSATELP